VKLKTLLTAPRVTPCWRRAAPSRGFAAMQDGDCRLGKGNRNAELFLVVVVNIPY